MSAATIINQQREGAEEEPSREGVGEKSGRSHRRHLLHFPVPSLLSPQSLQGLFVLPPPLLINGVQLEEQQT